MNERGQKTRLCVWRYPLTGPAEKGFVGTWFVGDEALERVYSVSTSHAEAIAHAWELTHPKKRPTKCSEIPDALVVRLAEAFFIRESDTGVVLALVAELGIPEKLARVKVERLSHKGLLDFGTSPYYAWPTEMGLELLETM